MGAKTEERRPRKRLKEGRLDGGDVERRWEESMNNVHLDACFYFLAQ